MRSVKMMVLALATLTWGCQGPAQLFSRTQILMGDVMVRIQIQAPEKASDAAFRAMGGAFHLAAQIEAEVSEHRASSQTAQVNRSTGPVTIGRHLKHLLQRSLEMSLITDGYFDITFASPDPSATYRDIILSDDGTMAGFRLPGRSIAVSGIAKGYIVDQMSQWLIRNGWNNFLINAGGEIRAQGRGPSGSWVVSVLPPSSASGRAACTIKLHDWSMATSGLSERGFHIIHPPDKKPVDDLSIAVSVLAPDTETADAIATAILAAGKEYHPLIAQIISSEDEIVALVVSGSRQVTTFGRESSHAEITCQTRAGDSTAGAIHL